MSLFNFLILAYSVGLQVPSRVLITGGRAPVALEWARALSNQGYEVHIADSLKFNLTRFSSAVFKFHLLPEAHSDPKKYVNAIASLCKKNGIETLLPTCEEIFYLSWGKEKIEKYAHLLSNELSILRKIHSKFEFSKLVDDFEIHCPKTTLIETESELDLYREQSRKLVFKPEFSRFASETLIQPQSKELQNIQPTPQKKWVIQEFVGGTEYATHGFSLNGKFISNTIYEPKYKFGKGSGTYFKKVENQKIDNFVRKFCRRYKIHGQIGFDFIEKSNGDIFVLEGNPRATSGIHLREPSLRPGHTSIERTARMVTPATILAQIGFRFNSLLNISFWKDLRQAKDVILTRKDLLPLLSQFLCFVEILYRSITRKIKLTSAATYDIEWNGGSFESE